MENSAKDYQILDLVWNIYSKVNFLKLYANNKKILFILSSRERKHAGLILIMILIMALLDMIGVHLYCHLWLCPIQIIQTSIILNKILNFQAYLILKIISSFFSSWV